MIAVNVSDMTRDSILAVFLIAPVMHSHIQVNAEPKNIDGQAVLLGCDNEQARAIVDVVRNRYSKNVFRFYESKTGKTWDRI